MRVNNPKAGNEAIRAIDERNAFVMHTLLNGVRKRPGRHRTPRLPRAQAPPTWAAKPGTLEQRARRVVCGLRLAHHGRGLGSGYDQMRPLGSTETGGGLVLPIWIDYMKTAIKDEPPYRRRQPSSVVLFERHLLLRRQCGQGRSRCAARRPHQAGKPAKELVRDQIF